MTSRRGINMSSKWLPLVSEEGSRRFFDCGPGALDLRLLQACVPQPNEFFCGISTFAAVLRTLSPMPDGEGFSSGALLSCFDPWPLFEATGVRSLEQVTGRSEGHYAGLAIEDLAAAFMKAGFGCELTYGAALDSETLLQISRSAIEGGEVIVAAYNAKLLDQAGTGHFAPVLAIHLESRSLLIADPARHRNGWFWIGVDDILNAMTELRQPSGRPRGILRVYRSGRLDHSSMGEGARG